MLAGRSLKMKVTAWKQKIEAAVQQKQLKIGLHILMELSQESVLAAKASKREQKQNQ